MTTDKIKFLIEQKEKIEKLIKIETDKRRLEIGKLAQAENLHHWSDEALQNLFKHARLEREEKYLDGNDINKNGIIPEKVDDLNPVINQKD